MEATTSSEYQVYKLSFSSNQTVAQVKEAVANLTKLPISNQQWLGWPHFVTPATTLEESHINYPVHDFKLKPSNSILKHTRRRYNTRLNVSIFLYYYDYYVTYNQLWYWFMNVLLLYHYNNSILR